jgi:hypothetical protein
LGGHLLVVLVRAGMTREIATSVLKQGPARRWHTGIASYFGVYFLQFVALGVVGGVFFLLASELPPTFGTWSPAPVFAHALWALAGIAATTATLVFLDLWRIALFVDSRASSLRTAGRCWRKHWGHLLAFRSGRIVLTLVTSTLAIRLALAPGDHGLLSAAFSLVLAQALLMVGLLVEVLWLEFVARRLGSVTRHATEEETDGPLRSVVEPGADTAT